jgi:hypothetical protein
MAATRKEDTTALTEFGENNAMNAYAGWLTWRTLPTSWRWSDKRMDYSLFFSKPGTRTATSVPSSLWWTKMDANFASLKSFFTPSDFWEQMILMDVISLLETGRCKSHAMSSPANE